MTLAVLDDRSYDRSMTEVSPRPDKRQLILNKGSEVMARHGYHGTGVQDIVQAAGIPKGSFYHYFASKEDFAIEALAALYQPRLDRYASALSNEQLSPRQRVLTYYQELIAHFARQERLEFHCFIGSLSFEMAKLSQPIGQAVNAIQQRSVELLSDCLEQAQGAEELAAEVDCRALAEFIANAWEGALMRMKVTASVAPLQIFLDQLAQLLRWR